MAPSAPEPDSANRGASLNGHIGVAVLAVVVFHVYQFSNVDHFLYFGSPAYSVLNSLDAAVPWLFVITGFLLFEPIARRAIHGGPPPAAGRFLMAQAVRLLPVYYVAVIVVWLLRQPRLPGDWRDLVEHLTFTQVFDGKRIFYTIGPAWAVSVAVIFCLVLMALTAGLATLCRRLPDPRTRTILIAATIAALAACSWLWKAWMFGIEHRPTETSFATWFGPVANLDNFAAGMAVALAVTAAPASWALGKRLLLSSAGLALVVIAFVIRTPGTWSAVFFPTVCSAGFACIVAAHVLSPPSDGLRVLAPLRAATHWVGMISLSVYLWHEPLMLALWPRGLVRQDPQAFGWNLLLVLPLAIVLGWLSYSAIELPVLRLAQMFDRLTRRRTAEAAELSAS